MDFEARFIITNNIYKNYVKRIIWYNHLIKETILLGFLLILIFIGYNYSNSLFISAMTCFMIILITILLEPFIMYKNIINSNKKLNNDKDNECIVSFSDEITVVQGRYKFSIDYEQINKIYLMDNIIVLSYSGQNGIIVDLNKFIIGDKTSFKKYILKRCNRVGKIIKR